MISSKNLCVFVSSSDNTKDVFSSVSRSFIKCWPHCPYGLYVGLNSPENVDSNNSFVPIFAPISGWRSELREQISRLPQNYKYILLFLDDFLILSTVNSYRINHALNYMKKNRLKYLRLIPLNRAFLPLMLHRVRLRYRNIQTYSEKIPQNMPYYSSLQVAIWERSHLMNMLNLPGSIWAFENQKIQGARHHAVVGCPLIEYVHLVEKGSWQPYAKRLLEETCGSLEAVSRPIRSPMSFCRIWFDRVKFQAIGYSYLKARKKLQGG